MLNKQEILRYLGASHSDEQLDRMIERAQWELTAAARPRHVFRRFPISVDKTGVTLGGTRWQSKSLAAHLNGCGEAFLFALTLGPGVDVLLKRYSVSDMPFVPVLQACAAEYTEFCADRAQQLLECEARGQGLYLRPRYSPGYGDFPLNCQRFLFDALDISKKIGVCLTENDLMVPLKSITAVVGLSPDPSLCHVGKCMTCDAKNCPFRKEQEHE